MGSAADLNFANERIIAGGIPGMSMISLRGRNTAISTSFEDIWAPGSTYAKLTTAVAFEAVSSSANDAAAGTGARTISVDLIDGNYAASTVTVTLNGTTPVAITGTFLACNGVRVSTTGSGLQNAGNIDIRTVSGSAVQRRISSNQAALGQDFDFLYTVPANYIGILKTIEFSATGVTGDLTCFAHLVNSSGVDKGIGGGNSSLYVTGFNGAMGKISLGSGVLVPEKTLILATANVSAGAGSLSAQGELVLIYKGVTNAMGF